MIYLWLTTLLSPLLRFLLRYRPPTRKRILIIQTAKIGDFVCTTPIIRELCTRYPDSTVHLLINPINEPLIRHNPYGIKIHLLPKFGVRGIRGKFCLYRLLRRERIDLTICVSPNLTFLVVPLWALVSERLSVLPNFGGNSYRRAKNFLTASEVHEAGRLLLKTEFKLLEALDIHSADLRKEAWSKANADDIVAPLLADYDANLVGIGVSSGNKLKELGIERLVQISSQILQRSTAIIVFIGGPDDRELAAALVLKLQQQGFSGRLIDATAKFSLDILPALLARLRVYVGVDSGITYLADAVRVPVVDLMGPADADDQRPTGDHAIVLRSHLPCAPCSHAFLAPYSCKINSRACVTEVSINSLTEPVLNFLTQKSVGDSFSLSQSYRSESPPR